MTGIIMILWKLRLNDTEEFIESWSQNLNPDFNWLQMSFLHQKQKNCQLTENTPL